MSAPPDSTDRAVVYAWIQSLSTEQREAALKTTLVSQNTIGVLLRTHFMTARTSETDWPAVEALMQQMEWLWFRKAMLAEA